MSKENLSDENGCLANLFSEQSVEGTDWLFLNAYRKMQARMT